MKKSLQLRSKNQKHDCGTDVVFFVSAYVTYSLVERLTVLLGSKTLGTKKRNS